MALHPIAWALKMSALHFPSSVGYEVNPTAKYRVRVEVYL